MAVPTSEHPLKSLRIFLVENHPDTLEYLQMYLELFGHTVQTADSMTRALAELQLADYDMLISDVGLPDSDGWMLMRRLQLSRSIYAVAMSGFGMGSDQLRSQEAGYRHHLIKPIKPEDLDAVLAEASRELSAPR